MDKTLELAKFTDQPFRLLPGEKVTVWAGYREILDRLLEIVESPRADRVGLYEFAILHGVLGAGKSHALRYLRHLIRERRKDEFRSIVVYVERLKVAANTDFMALYQAIMRLLKEDLAQIGEVVDEIADKQVEEAWDTASDDLKKHMKKQDFQQRELPVIYSKLSPTYPALPRLLSGVRQGDEVATAILAGGKPKGANPARYGLDSFIETEYEALRCLAALINLCTRIDGNTRESPLFKCFYLFIDEVEALADFPTRNIQSINYGIRDLVNACPEHFCLLLGASAEAAELDAWLEDYVMTRLSRDPIEIPELDPDQAVQFLKEVMQQYRQSDAKVSETHPFEEDAVREIALQTTQRTPRNLFRACQTVLRKVVLSGRLEANGIIGVTDVQEFLV
ncbi:hypothetical protein M1N92_00505 [Dehalococcoidia bacterium]|nr:hypothetical protein [Dehalococcoidia bacterium]